MRLRKKKTLMDQAADFVDSLKPALESAVDTAKDAVETALDTAKDTAKDVADKAGPVLSDARDTVVEKTAPVLTEARVRGSAALADARESAGPALAQGRATAAAKAAAASALVAEKAGESREYAAAKVAELKGEPPPKKGSKLKTLLLITGLAGIAAFVYKKVTSSDDSWQSAYTPAPPEQTAPAPAGGLSAAALDEMDESAPGDDGGGASPDEALADSATEPHAVTTPEHPVESVQLDEGSEKN